jgi:hypothetical protein
MPAPVAEPGLPSGSPVTATIELHSLACPGCGGDQRWDPARQVLACTACGRAGALLASAADDDADDATAVIPATDAHGRMPQMIAPFAVVEADARANALAWIRAQWLAPSSLSRHARRGRVKGAYLPFWVFDAHAVGHWEAPGVRGIIEMDFDNIPVSADPAADAPLLASLEPWPARWLRPFDARFAAGWAVELGPRELVDALPLAHQRMERDLIAAARRNQTSKQRDKMRLLGAEYVRETSVLALLPVWSLDYVYLGRLYRIAVNGATGKAVGTAPVSLVKVALAAAAVLGIGLLVALRPFAGN